MNQLKDLHKASNKIQELEKFFIREDEKHTAQGNDNTAYAFSMAVHHLFVARREIQKRMEEIRGL